MDFDALFPNRFLKAGKFAGRDVTLTIAGVTLEKMDGRNGPEQKAILSFRERPQQLVLNKTNALCIKAMFGRETNAWSGKRVTFYPMEFHFEGNDLAIRVRGSPDLAGPITFTLKLPRKKDRELTMIATKVAAQAATKPAPSSPPDEPPPLSDLDVPPPEEP
jgi:hypothetical protein